MSKNDFADYVASDLLARVPNVQPKSMFGGHGFFRDGLMFALIAYDKLYFKVDDNTRAKYEAKGCEPFTYQKKGHKPMTMSYYEVPTELLEDPEGIVEWADEAYEVAVKAKKK